MKRILPIIVISQFLCTTLWFAGNSILSDIASELNLSTKFIGHITSAIQIGFISGTLVFAVFSISDRFSPSRVFFFSSILGSLFNLGLSLDDIHESGILVFRFLTGFFLAGIYPVGMKIASDYYQKGLGKSLGFLVGALVVGTAFPHLLKDLTGRFQWQYVVYTTSILSLIGGLSIYLFVPDGPFRKQSHKLKLTDFMRGFKLPQFRSIAFGYFGHMWELYTFWAFVPVILINYKNHFNFINLNVPLLSFLIIGVGGLSCVFGGFLSQYYGAKKIATIALFLSGLCCVISPLFLFSNSIVLVAFLFFWGIVVIADSPLFSSLIAQSAPEESRGSSLTIVNCLGFSITIVSIEFLNYLSDKINEQYIYMLLSIGPILGLIALLKSRKVAKS